jgi:hypothetical protein
VLPPRRPSLPLLLPLRLRLPLLLLLLPLLLLLLPLTVRHPLLPLVVA